MIYYWILMLSRAGETAGLPMAVFVNKDDCDRQVAFYYETHAKLGIPEKPREMRWHCIGVSMPASTAD
jgi:hypothetical protein